MIYSNKLKSLRIDSQNPYYQHSRKSIKKMLKIDDSFNCTFLSDEDSSYFSKSMLVSEKNSNEKIQYIEGTEHQDGRFLRKVNERNKNEIIDLQASQLQSQEDCSSVLKQQKTESFDISYQQDSMLGFLNPNQSFTPIMQLNRSTTSQEEKQGLKRPSCTFIKNCKALVIDNEHKPDEPRQIQNISKKQNSEHYIDLTESSPQKGKTHEQQHNNAKYLNPRFWKKKGSTRFINNEPQQQWSNFYDNLNTLASLKRKTLVGLRIAKKQFETTIRVIDRRLQKSKVKARHFEYLWKLGNSVTCWKSLRQPQTLLELYICQARSEGNRIIQYLPPNLQIFKSHSSLISKIQRGVQQNEVSQQQIKIDLYKRQFANQILLNFQTVIFDLVLKFNKAYNKTIFIDLDPHEETNKRKLDSGEQKLYANYLRYLQKYESDK